MPKAKTEPEKFSHKDVPMSFVLKDITGEATWVDGIASLTYTKKALEYSLSRGVGIGSKEFLFLTVRVVGGDEILKYSLSMQHLLRVFHEHASRKRKVTNAKAKR